MSSRTREQDLEMWLADAQRVIDALCAKVDWSEVSGTWARDLARHRLGIETILEGNPKYLLGKNDRLAGSACTDKDEAYRLGYYGVSGDVPRAVDACDWTEERKAHEDRLHQRFLDRRAKRE